MQLSKIVLSMALVSGLGTVTVFAQPTQTPTTIVNPPVQAAPAQFAPAPPTPRVGTPKEQIESDLKALFMVLNNDSVSNDHDYFGLPLLISGARIGFFGLSEWKTYFLSARDNIRFRLDRIEIETLNTDAARVKVSYALVTPNALAPAERLPADPDFVFDNKIETLDLKRESIPLRGDDSARWRIVPPSYEKVRELQALSLANIAYFGSQRAGTLSQLRAHVSQNQLKQIGMGVVQFTQDYDEQYRFQNEFWREALSGYVKHDASFLIPGTQTPYTFNDNLSDKIDPQINARASTVLFYEGENEKPTFRYDGKAAICFADGHVALVSREDAKTLIWKP